MTKQKACKVCKKIYEEEKCPGCDSKESIEGFKGRVYIFNPEMSEVAKNMNIKSKGNYAIKTR